jgi:hypothetical protein
VDRVAEQQHGAQQPDVPERDGHHALAGALGDEPLDDEPAGPERRAHEARDQPGQRGFEVRLHPRRVEDERGDGERDRHQDPLARGAVPAGVDQEEVPRVEEAVDQAAEQEDRILKDRRVDGEERAARDGQPPEGDGDDALLPLLGREPLHEESRGEEALSDETQGDPERRGKPEGHGSTRSAL